jgi:transcriptional regulatory protein LEU3
MRAKKMACVECRQQKSKCDAQELYPAPCSRCSKKKITCSLQSDYKRTYKRAKFQQIEEELEELKKNLSQAGVDSLLKQLKERKFQPHELKSEGGESEITHSQLASVGGTGASSSFHGSPKDPEMNGPSILRDVTPFSPSQVRLEQEITSETYVELTEEVLKCAPKQFGDISLSSEQIRELFIEFVHKYHRFLPIVEVEKGPERLYRLSPVLFWTIVSVALRHLSTDILMSLAPLLKTALAEITISPITRYLPSESDEPILNVSTVHSVQALLLYTFWPPLTSSLSADSSWNTVGIAIFQAIRIGLNGPGTTNYHVQQQQQTEMAQVLNEHIKTWISCNIVSQTIATAFGYPAFVSFDSSVVGCMRPGTPLNMPKCIKQMVEISHFEDQMAKVLNSNTVDMMGLADPTERLPLLKVLCQQLDELELKLTSEGIDDIRKFQILAARVHLLTYYFLDNSRVANFELRRGLVTLYNAALALLSHAGSVSNRDPKFIKYVPGVFVLKIWQASCIVAKLIHSPLNEVLDIGAGRQLYMVAIQLASRASILKHDMAYRTSGIMRNMWQLFKLLKEKKASNLEVTVRSRMSASVFFDCLWMLREQVGMVRLNPNRKNSHDEVSNSNDEDGDDEEEEFGSEEVDLTTGDPGTVGSENSAKSTSSSQKRRPRSLSNNFNAEHAARKIIRTIPLDPAPISLKRDSDSPKAVTSSLKDILQKHSPGGVSASSSQKDKNSPLNPKHTPIVAHTEKMAQLPQDQQVPGISPSNIPSLDLSDDWNSDMLWKDVDSVMNDFGFNTDDLNKTAAIAEGANYQSASLFSHYGRSL